LGWAISFVLLVLSAIGLPGLFFLMAVESFGIPPLPGEIILAFSGFLIVEGTPNFDWVSVVGVGLAGSVAGAWIAYELARREGPRLLARWGGRLRIAPREIETSTRIFLRHGELTVFAARLVPLVRAYISYPAGAAQMDRPKFLAFTAMGALPFTVLMVYLGVVLGQNYGVLTSYLEPIEIATGLALLAVGVWVAVSRRSRRAQGRFAAP
jgi:membrane protein DedA with SNARE-associated domain